MSTLTSLALRGHPLSPPASPPVTPYAPSLARILGFWTIFFFKQSYKILCAVEPNASLSYISVSSGRTRPKLMKKESNTTNTNLSSIREHFKSLYDVILHHLSQKLIFRGWVSKIFKNLKRDTLYSKKNLKKC